MGVQTTVHLVRHGEVHNPLGVLYGRRDGYHLSDLGQAMAQRIGETIGDRDIVHIDRHLECAVGFEVERRSRDQS